MTTPQRLSIAIAALGGQGGGVLADWLVDAAEAHGWRAQSTSVPGVAQRTGATIYYVELCAPIADRETRPVLALMPSPGEVDVLIAAEWIEAGRAIVRGLVTPERTTLVASTHRIYSIAEKSALGDGIVAADAVLAAARAEAKHLVNFDMEALAQRHGTMISAVLLGAVSASDALPFPATAYEEAIRRSGIAVEASLRGFEAGVRGARAAAMGDLERIGPTTTTVTPSSESTPRHGTPSAGFADLDARIEVLPQEIRVITRAGVERLIDYQDLGYAMLYLERLSALVATESAATGGADRRTSVAVARYLALWMSYEDVIRVADLKTRGARFARVREAAGARAEEIVEIDEFFHPRIEEICDMMPVAVGRWTIETPWTRRVLGRLTRRGRTVRTSSLRGFLLLRMIAGLQRFRRGMLRYRTEQVRIEAWLATITRSLSVDPALAAEIAECQRLVKGYGETHARGRERFEAILSLAIEDPGRAELAPLVRRLRATALADEDGQRFADELRILRSRTEVVSSSP